jgi:hypothetical protein
MKQVDVEFLSEILQKRDQIMKKNNGDEYIDVPDDCVVSQITDGDEDDRSTEEVYRGQIRYNIAKNLHDLTDTIKIYLEKERRRKIRWSFFGYTLGFVGISGLLVFNDYILITYFV